MAVTDEIWLTRDEYNALWAQWNELTAHVREADAIVFAMRDTLYAAKDRVMPRVSPSTEAYDGWVEKVKQ